MANEKTVSSIVYDDTNKKLIFTFDDDSTIESYIMNTAQGKINLPASEIQEKLKQIYQVSAEASQSIGNINYLTKIKINNVPYSFQKPLPFSETQIQTLNGLDLNKITLYDGYATTKQDKLSETQTAAVNSGINATLVNKYNNYQEALDGKQARLTDEQITATRSGITSTKVQTYDRNNETLTRITSGLIFRTVDGVGIIGDGDINTGITDGVSYKIRRFE